MMGFGLQNCKNAHSHFMILPSPNSIDIFIIMINDIQGDVRDTPLPGDICLISLFTRRGDITAAKLIPKK